MQNVSTAVGWVRICFTLISFISCISSFCRILILPVDSVLLTACKSKITKLHTIHIWKSFRPNPFFTDIKEELTHHWVTNKFQNNAWRNVINYRYLCKFRPFSYNNSFSSPSSMSPSPTQCCMNWNWVKQISVTLYGKGSRRVQSDSLYETETGQLKNLCDAVFLTRHLHILYLIQSHANKKFVAR